MKAKKKYRCNYSRHAPAIFSDEDADLRLLAWRVDKSGYVRLTRNYVDDSGSKRATTILAHRIIVARVIGRTLNGNEICDHIDFNRSNNSRDNLRVVTKRQNAQHRSAMSKSGHRNVTWNKKNNKWQVQVYADGKNYYCGLFANINDAVLAATEKRKSLNFFGT